MQSLRRGRKDQITSAYLPSILKCCGTLKFLSCIKKAGIREMKENSLNPKRQPDNNSHGLQRKHCLDVWSEVISQRNEEQIHSCAAELKHGKTRDVYKSMLSLSGVAVLWRVKHWTTVSFFSCDCISDNKNERFCCKMTTITHNLLVAFMDNYSLSKELPVFAYRWSTVTCSRCLQVQNECKYCKYWAFYWDIRGVWVPFHLCVLSMLLHAICCISP